MLGRFILFLVFTAIFFNGCGATKQVVTPAKKVIPSWVEAPLPVDTNLYMYGIGIDENRDLAIKVALNDMVAKLGITIESSYESDMIVQGSYLNLIVKNQIKSVVSEIKINNYTVIESAKISYREFAVMLKTDKKIFVKGLKQSLKSNEASIDREFKAVKDRDILTRYNTKKFFTKKADELLSSILIISELDSSFDTLKHLDFVDEKQQEFLKESKKIKFFVSGDARSQRFVDDIKNNLAQNGYSVTNSKHNSLEVVIKTNDRVSIDAIAVVTISVRVYDKLNRIGGKSFVLKERYNGSMEGVYKNASIHLSQDIKQLGLDEVLGINLKMD